MRFLRKQKYSSQSDEQLMTLVGRGEIPAFDEIYSRYGKRLLFYFHRMLGQDEPKAQDLLHDLFLKIQLPEALDADIQIVDMQGATRRRLKTQKRQIDVKIDELPAGAYIVHIRTAKGNISRTVRIEK